MFEKKSTEKETKPQLGSSEVNRKEIKQEEKLKDDNENLDEVDIQSRKKASTFSQKLNMFNRNAADSTRLIKKDLEKKDLRIYLYDSKTIEKDKKDDWKPSADYEGQLTSRRKHVEVEDKKETEKESNQDEKTSTDPQNEKLPNNKEKIEGDDAEEIDDVYDDIYISGNNVINENEDDSKTSQVDISFDKDKDDVSNKNQNFDYKKLSSSQDVSMNCDTVINISNLSINQNNYNPIFNSFRSDDKKENYIDVTQNSSKEIEEVIIHKKDIRSIIRENFFRYRYIYLLGFMIVILLIIYMVI
jgi:hypothetical protein